MNTLLVTGSSGLIGSEVVDYFCGLDWKMHGVDNTMRADFGGGRGNSVSILEAFEHIAVLSGKNMNSEYVDKNREGDHISYIVGLSKMQAHYPSWNITTSLDRIFEESCRYCGDSSVTNRIGPRP